MSNPEITNLMQQALVPLRKLQGRFPAVIFDDADRLMLLDIDECVASLSTRLHKLGLPE